MDLKILARNIDIDSRSQQYIQKKFARLERHLSNLSDAKLEVSRTSSRAQTDRVVAQMTLTAGGRVLRGQERGLNLFAAIDAVTDVMDRQIRRYKGKFYRSQQAKKAGKPGPATEVEQLAVDPHPDIIDAQDDEAPRVVRTKQFSMRPMFVEDAITEMELVGHSFYLFYNADSDSYNVVYRRQDGEYGVIEPSLA